LCSFGAILGQIFIAGSGEITNFLGVPSAALRRDTRGMAGRVSSPVLVGRDDELQALQATLDAADDGRPSLTLLCGEGGVGKSRLVKELIRCRNGRSGLVLCGNCVQLSGGELPYAPIASALRELGHGPFAGMLDDLPAEVRDDLARVVPELASDESAPDDSGPTAFSQARLFEQLLRAFRHLAERTSVLLIIEDLHWADNSTRDFIAFAVRNLHSERMALLVTYRTDELPPGHPMRALLGELVRCDGVVRVDLGRLTRSQVRRQLEGITGAPPQSQLVDEIFKRSDGNPFLTEELLLARRAGWSGRLPLGLRDTLLARVEQLPAEAHQVLRILAVAGRPIGHAVLEVAVGISDAALAAGLRAAVSDQILVLDPQGAALGFRHALVGEGIYTELLPGERRALHGRFARALEEEGTASSAELARHYELAGDAPAAVSASLDAGLAATRVFAFAEALVHFRRALQLWDDAEAGAMDRVDVLGHAAEAARFTGDYELAMEFCHEALKGLDASSDAARAARFHERLGEYCFWDDRSALASYRRAFALLTTDQPAERARVLAGEGRVCMRLMRWDEARARCEAALTLASAVGAEAEEGSARTTLGVALAFGGEHAAGEAHLREARRIAERHMRPDDLAHVYLHLAEVLRLRGRIGEALAVMDDGLAMAQRLGMEASFGRFMIANAAEDLLRLGRWDEAERRLEDNAQRTLRRSTELLHHSVSAQLAAARGDAEGAREHLEPAMVLCREPSAAEFAPGVYAAAAELALWEDKPIEACRIVAEGLKAIGPLSDPLNTPILHHLGVRAEANAAESARARARPNGVRSASERALRLVEGLDELITRYSGTATPPEAVSYRLTCEAELSRLAETPTPEAWDGAVASWEGLDARYHVAYSQWRLGEALLAIDGDRGRATQALAAAYRTARQLHARPLAARIERLARLAKVSLHRAPVASDREPDAAESASDRGLSTPDKQVLALIADGLTNREIGRRLLITENSTSVHVSQILFKVGARNRVTAAAIAHRLGLAAATGGARTLPPDSQP
jgi:DNA-binding CsgD family transcriptional regulator